MTGGSLSEEVSVQGGLYPGGSLSRGGVSVPGGLYPGGFLSGGVFIRETPRTVMSGRYASYRNAFLLTNSCETSMFFFHNKRQH